MRGSLRRRARRVVLGMVLVLAVGGVLAIGARPASAVGPEISWTFEGTQAPGGGAVTVNGSGWPGAPGPTLYQCADVPEDEEQFWQVCDQATALQVENDPVDVEFAVKDVLDLGEPFPPATVNAMGNGTMDCEADGAHCMIVAIEWGPGDFENATVAWANLGYEDVPGYVPYFTAEYGTPSIEVEGATTGLKDGASVTITSSGHRPGTDAMTYLCRGDGLAYPGGCDPVAGSRDTTESSALDNGVYTATVKLPRFVWDNDTFGNAGWYDCADGCSLAVVSAGNLQSQYSGPITFEAVNVEQNPSILSVEKVYVNRYGAINVNGSVLCTAAMAAWGLDDEAAAGGNISWTARQPVGRKGVVTGHYESAIASICHDPDTAGPYLWGTKKPITSDEDWWIYPDIGGKFVAGNVTITVRYDGGVYGGWWGAENYVLTGATQWNVKAVSVKK